MAIYDNADWGALAVIEETFNRHYDPYWIKLAFYTLFWHRHFDLSSMTWDCQIWSACIVSAVREADRVVLEF